VKQIVQNLRTGVLELLEVPCPQAARGHLLVQSRATLISAGTERSLVEFGKANLLAKARQNPERVKQVLTKIKADGLLPTLEAVFNRLDEPLPLGYCNAGIVVEVGPGVTGFAVGDRVASNGNHAELVHVPTHLCAKIPDRVTDEEACFAVLGSIALQGIRLLQPELGETVVVFGLGLVGLMAVQMLAASGTRVIGIDLDRQRLKLAESFGALSINPGDGGDPVAATMALTQGHGVDGVLITASAKHDTIMSQSAQMSRKRGRLVLVGVVNLELNRAEFYEKELTFQVSCSYGPGRYDAVYEQQGHDYPYAFVRWTEQRNIQAVLELMDRRGLDVDRLTSHRIAFDDAVQAYELLSSGMSQLGVVLVYPHEETGRQHTVALHAGDSPAGVHVAQPVGRAVVGVIGAGTFTKGVLLPALAKTDATLHSIVSAGGVSAAHAARKFGFRKCSTDYQTLLADDQINTVFITTRHHLHARMVAEALDAGKHVFVEKPLALDPEGLELVCEAYLRSSGQQLMVGFNRRFAPMIVQLKQLLCGRTGPLCMSMLVNAGAIPADHWVHDPQVGGGRIIGEGCHWIDLLSHLGGSPIVHAHASHLGPAAVATTRGDHCSISLTLADGSIGTVHYFANGHRAFPKERFTAFADGKVLEMDNYRVLRGYGLANFRRAKSMRQDKGHLAECRQFIDRVVKGGEPLIPFDQLRNVTETCFRCQWGSAADAPQPATV
jgi:predicted dehydrogenase/threonine dehydrogenase-like Zn-dependent dehydrogenase